MYLNDMELNREFVTESVRVDREKMVAFAMEYDPFRLHYDEEYAKNTRFGQLVAPGVMTFMSIWAKIMETGFLGEELIAGKSTHIEWFKPVHVDDVLTGKVRVTKKTQRNPYNGIAEVTTDIYNQNGELVLTDVTESIVKCRPE